MYIATTDGTIRDLRRDASPLKGLGGTSSVIGPSDIGIPLLGTTEVADYSRIYRTNPWVFAAVRHIAWGLSRSMIGVYRYNDKDDRIRVRYDRPGSDIAGKDLDRKLNGAAGRIGPQRRMRRTLVDYLVYGDALWVEQPDGYYHVPYKRWSLLEDDGEILGFRLTGTNGKHRDIPAVDTVLFSCGDDPNSSLGQSSIGALTYTLQLYEALQRHLVKFFENSARPSGNLKLQPNAGIEAMEFMREQFRQLYTSPENAGKVIVTTGEFQAITAEASQAQIVELTKLSREEIAAVYRIPAPVLGILDNAIKANVKELREQDVRDALGSYAPALEDDMRAQIVAPMAMYDGLYVEFDLDAHLRPDLEGMGSLFVNLEKTITTNERRGMLNLPKLDAPEADTVASTPGSEYLGMAQANDGVAASGGESVATDELSVELANAIGVLVRSGYDPEAVVRAAGLDPIEHLGLLPVTLQKVEQFDANAEKAQAEADKAGEEPPDPADAEDNPSGEDDPAAEPEADPGNPDPAEVQ